ncbi:MAG: sigma-54 dependent transcriptional regulator [Nitrospiraceae bacterium]|nr:sigma-54 dependent transcriptional regulator [Nitrospiraceae bacterium]
MKYRVLIIEDETEMRVTLRDSLAAADYEVSCAERGTAGMNALKSGAFDVIVTEAVLPDVKSLDVLNEIGSVSHASVIVITSHGTIKDAVKAIKMGAFDYITKPFSIDEFLIAVERALDVRMLREENIRLRKDITKYFNRPNIIGASEAMKKIFSVIEKVSTSDSTVLLLGESGTGKELVATTIHYQSSRREKPLVRLNCAALPEGLIESELFGHEKGAFTGAMKRKEGRFELADEGTIFLDEIGDLPLSTQVKLLRVLQERSFERVGGIETVRVDVRVIAATNKNLEEEVKAGRFREDLYFRLNVIPVTVPPLRERREDILPLIEYFLEKYERKTAREVHFSKEAIDALLEYDYPGNIRELENIIERCATLSVSHVIERGDLPPFVLKKTYKESLLPLAVVISDAERDYIEKVLEITMWNRTKAAEILGISRKNLWERIKILNLTK